MKLTRIELRRFPGIDGAFEIAEFSPTFNLVLGPNASGKSSLCRAVAATLWPRADRPDGADVITHWREADGTLLRATLTGVVRWQRDGVDAEPPRLPDDGLAPCFRLGLRDLLTVEGGDLPARIRVAMSGGYDLRAVAKLLRCRPSLGQAEEKELREADHARRSIEGDHRALAQDEDKLVDWQEQLAAATRAQSLLQRLDAAQQAARARAELTQLEGELENFPEAMERLSGEEPERLAVFDADLDRALKARDQSRRDLELALRRRDACGFADGPVDEPTLEAMLLRSLRLNQVEERRATAQGRLAQCRAELEEAIGALGADADPGRLEGPDLERLDEWVRDAFELREERSRLEAQRPPSADLGSGPMAEPDRIRRGLGRLRDWMATSDRQSTTPTWQVAALAVLAIGGVTLGFSVHPALFVVPGLALGALFQAAFSRTRAAAQRDHAQREFEALSLDPPADWRRCQVADCLTRLERRLDEIGRVEWFEAEREQVAQQLGRLSAREKELAERRSEFVASVGFDPGASVLRSGDLFARVQNWRAARSRGEAAAAELGSIEVELQRGLDVLRTFTAQHASGDINDALAAQTALGALKERGQRWRNTEEQRIARELALADREAALSTLTERRADLFRNIGLDPADLEAARRRLSDRAGRLEAWRDAQKRRAELSRDLEAALRDVGEEKDLLDLADEQIAARREEAQARADDRDRILGRIKVTRHELEKARQGSVLEAANARVGAAREALAERREVRVDAEAACFFLEDVEQTFERQSRPAVLQNAMKRFASFTNHQFELRADLGDGAGEFRALETASGRGLSLDQLSDGTRMQLWLATRLAFAERAEFGETVPIFLDEALTASDPERFRAVAENILALAQEGRQVFYLTANPNDVAAWNQIAREVGAPEPLLADLAHARGRAAAAIPRGDALALFPAVPSPDGLSPVDYAAKLGVPPLDAFGTLGSTHLYHALCGDLALLYRLVATARVTHIGEYLSLEESGRVQLLPSADERQQVRLQIDVVDAFLGAWRIGRGRPVDRSVLASSSAVTDTFLDRISELCDELGGDAERLLAAIEAGSDERVKRFKRGDRVQQLRHTLEEGGHLNSDVPLTAGELCARVAHAVSGRMTAEDAAKRVEELATQLVSRG